MLKSQLEELLLRFQKSEIDLGEVLNRLRDLPYENLEFAHVDHHRQLRQGFPEVIFCAGKTTAQIHDIIEAILKQEMPVLATRADEKVATNILKAFPKLHYNEQGRVLYSEPHKIYSDLDEKLLIVTAGTADMAVAEEAYQSAFMMGFKAKKIYDVGVSGIHRLFSYKDLITGAKVIIVVAGMEGALPSVVGGMTAVPLIAVPTSTGYGTSFKGITALLAMLNSCSSGVTVVNIDNGFGAAAAAAQILRLLVSDTV
jgi:NCAIR mutase (PurE)-related protein